MSNNLAFYQDSGMTSSLSRLDATQSDDGASDAADRVVYLGSPISGYKFQAASAPGVDDIAVGIIDSLTGLQIPATSIKLALTSGGLGAAVAGASIAIGTQILSGSANSVPVHVRIDIGITSGGIYENLSLSTSSTLETAV